VGIYAARDAKPRPSAPNNNVARRRKKVIGYVGFMAAEVLGQRLKLEKSEVRQPVLDRVNILDQRCLGMIYKKLLFEFWKIQFLY
jgi:hypothetical protein